MFRLTGFYYVCLTRRHRCVIKHDCEWKASTEDAFWRHARINSIDRPTSHVCVQTCSEEARWTQIERRVDRLTRPGSRRPKSLGPSSCHDDGRLGRLLVRRNAES